MKLSFWCLVIEAKNHPCKLVVDLSSVYVTSHAWPEVDYIHVNYSNLVKTVIGKVNMADSTPPF